MTGRAQEVYMNGKEVLDQRISSWLSAREEQRILWAEPTLKEFLQANGPLPSEVSCKPQPLRGDSIKTRRAAVKHSPEPVIATWPQDRLLASRVAMLICPIEGKADIRIGNYVLHLPPGQLCLLPPEIPRTDGSEPHLADTDDATAHCVLWWLKGSEYGLESWICVSQGKEHRVGYKSRIIVSHPQAKVLFNLLIHEVKNSVPQTNHIQQGLLQVIFGLIVRELHTNAVSAPAVQAEGASLGDPQWNPIQEAHRLIHDNLHRHLSVDEVAKLVYMSPSKFAERFRRETGETFNQYQSRHRVERAAKHLHDTDWTIAGVARACGMNVSHLRRLFHEYFGVSPQQYRQQSQVGRETSSIARASLKNSHIGRK